MSKNDENSAENGQKNAEINKNERKTEGG